MNVTNNYTSSPVSMINESISLQHCQHKSHAESHEHQAAGENHTTPSQNAITAVSRHKTSAVVGGLVVTVSLYICSITCNGKNVLETLHVHAQ